MFDWLKRLLGKQKPADSRKMEMAQILEMSGQAEARQHHYIFAHYALRSLLLRSYSLAFILNSPKGQEMLLSLWADVGKDILEQGLGEVLPPEGLEVVYFEGRSTNEHSGVVILIRLPEPVGITETYYVGIIARPKLGPEDVPLRYFTLEVGFSFDDPRTVLGEWDASTHYNYGDGPAPEPKAFADAIWDMYSTQ